MHWSKQAILGLALKVPEDPQTIHTSVIYIQINIYTHVHTHTQLDRQIEQWYKIDLLLSCTTYIHIINSNQSAHKEAHSKRIKIRKQTILKKRTFLRLIHIFR